MEPLVEMIGGPVYEDYTHTESGQQLTSLLQNVEGDFVGIHGEGQCDHRLCDTVIVGEQGAPAPAAAAAAAPAGRTGPRPARRWTPTAKAVAAIEDYEQP